MRRFASYLIAMAVTCLTGSAAAGLPAFRVDDLDLRGAEILDRGELLSVLPFGNRTTATVAELNYVAKLLALRPDVRSVRIVLPTATEPLTIEVVPESIIEKVVFEFDGRLRYGRDDLGAPVDYLSTPSRYDGDVTRAAARDLQARLRSVGYLDATVQPEMRWRHAYAGMLRLVVAPGRLHRVRQVNWIGPDVPPENSKLAALDLIDWPQDTGVLQQEVDEGIVDLRVQGYWDARAELACAADASRDGVCNVSLTTGPRIDFLFIGNNTFFAPDLLAALDLDNGQRYSAGDLVAFRQRLAEFYRREGFYKVEVTAAEEYISDGGVRRRIRYYISEDRRFSFDGIVFDGLDESIEEELRQRLNVASRRGDALFRGKERELTEELRDGESARVQVELQRLGYLNATVTDERLEFAEEADSVRWRVQVDPGRRYVWGDFALPATAGGQTLERPDALRAGHPADIDEARIFLEQWLIAMRDQGYLDAAVEMEALAADRVGEVSLHVETYAGPRYAIAYVLVDGVVRTRESAIRSILPIRQGDPAYDARLTDGRRVLMERRVFRQVNSHWLLRDATTGWVAANYQVVERNGGELEIGLLLTTGEGAGFDLRLGHNRIFGTFRSLRIAGSALYRPEEFFTGDFFRREPYLTRWGLRYREPIPSRRPLFGDVVGTIELNRNDRDIEWLAQTASLGPSFQPTADLTLSAGYLYEWFKTLRVKQDPYFAAGVAVTDQVDRLGGVRFSLLYEKFDNKFDPKGGWGVFQDLQYFNASLGGEHGMLRYEGSLRYIQDLFANVSLWLGLRGGAIAAETADAYRIRSKVFRLGGSGSVRGYARDAVSPYADVDRTGNALDQAVPVGGRWFANLQSELRFGLTDSIEFAAFEDNAVVGGFTGKFGGDNQVEAAGYGAGILYHTPAGPLRLDVGRKILDIPTDPDTFAVHFYVSTTF